MTASHATEEENPIALRACTLGSHSGGIGFVKAAGAAGGGAVGGAGGGGCTWATIAAAGSSVGGVGMASANSSPCWACCAAAISSIHDSVSPLLANPIGAQTGSFGGGGGGGGGGMDGY